MAGETLAAAAAAAGMSERAARKWQSGPLPWDGEAAAVVAHTRGPVRRRVELGSRAAAGGRHRRPATGVDAVQGAVPPASGPLSAGATADPAAAGSGVEGAVRSRPRGVLRAGSGPGWGSGVRLHGLEGLGGDASGVLFPHLLFGWVLSYSRWTYVGLALRETFEALVAGLQDALWTLGAVPTVLRHDNQWNVTGGDSAGRGASVSAVVAVGSGAGVHDVPVPGCGSGARSGSAAGSTRSRRG